MSDLSKMARVVGKGSETERLRAEISTRPVRFAFLIHKDLSLAGLIKVLELNSAMWGGVHNLLLPTDGCSITSDWWSNLVRFSPDKIVYCTEKGSPNIAEDIHQAIEREIGPFSLTRWDNWDAGPIDKDLVDSLGGMSITYAMNSLIGSLRSPKVVTKGWAKTVAAEGTDLLRACVVAQVGRADGLYNEQLTKGLSAPCIDFSEEDVGKYLDALAQLDHSWNPLSLTGRGLSQTMYSLSIGGAKGLSIVLIDKGIVEDICLFWSLRMTPSFHASFGEWHSEIIIPFDWLRSSRALRLVAERLAETPWANSDQITLCASSASKRRLNRLRERLQQVFKVMSKGANVAILSSTPAVPSSRLKDTDTRDEVYVKDGYLSFKRPEPKFGGHIRSGEWIVDAALGDSQGKQYDFPKSSQLNYMLCDHPSKTVLRWNRGFGVRFANERLSWRTNRKLEFLRVRLPSATEVFRPVFHDGGYKTKVSDRTPYNEGFRELLGSATNIKLLEEKCIRDLLWKMTSGDSYDISTMLGIMRVKKKQRNSLIADLVRQRVLLRGMTFRCEACGLLRWYPIHEISEEMRCAGCLRSIQPPVMAKVTFKLNELAARAVEQGAIPVLLTERFLLLRAGRYHQPLLGLEVRKDKDEPIDVDLVSVFHGKLLLAECKDFKDGVSHRTICSTLTQLRGIVALATEVGAQIVLLSTLLPDIPPELAEGVLKIGRRFKTAVHLVSLTNMALVDLKDPTKTIPQNKESLSRAPWR